VVLKALEIQGFKSFPDKVKISFDRGVTGVVGPNGSGKSNISDAIRWVLGETSARQLRGGGKMENVIFSGTGGKNKRAPMGFASVKLILDNTDRLVEVDNDEVIIGRKYYRSGESDYSINGQTVRLRDIYELFLDTGLGRDGYSIIGQGRIAEIVAGKSDERREIFEEASGIARYRYRKNEAEHRLAASEDNLSRLRDILGELESRVGPLEKESKKAQSFLEYSARRKELEVTLWMDNIQRAKEAVRTQQRKMEIAQGDYDADTRQIARLDEEMDALRAESEKLILFADECNRAIRSISEELAGSDSRIAVLQNNIEHNEQAIQEYHRQMQQEDADADSIAARIADAQEQISGAVAQVEEYEKNIAECTARLEELTAQNLASGERRSQLAAQLGQLTEQRTKLLVDQSAAEAAAAAAQERLQAASQELRAGEEKVARLKEELQQTKTLDDTLQEDITRLTNIKNGLQYKLTSRMSALQKARESADAVQQEIQSCEQRIKVLKELERSMEGYPNSVKAVMKAAANHQLRGIIGTVGSLLQVKPGYEVAVETALGTAMQNVVVSGETAAKAAIAFLKQSNAGRVTFLPLDTVQPHRLPDSCQGDVMAASDAVICDAKYQPAISNLLGGIAIAEDMNEASALARKQNYRLRVVTLDGQVINAGGSFTGGSVARSAGVFSRKQEIVEIEQRLLKLDEKSKDAREELHRAQTDVDALQAELTATDSELITVNGDKIRSDMELNRLQNVLHQQGEIFEQLKEECSQLTDAVEQNARNGEKAAADIASAAAQIQHLEQQMAVIDGNEDFAEARGKLSDRLTELKLASMACSKDIELHRQTVESLQSRSGQSSQLRTARMEGITRLQQLIESDRQEIDGVEQQKRDIQARIEAKEDEIRKAAAMRMTKEGEINTLNVSQRSVADHREEMSRELARLAERQEALKGEYEATVSKLWEEYELTLTDAAGCCVKFESVTELRRQVVEIRSKIKALGSVNVGSIDEFHEVNTRYLFLKEQVGDVEQAKAELQKLIAELSGEMKELFNDSFARINDHFGRIFAELFGGGSAQLVLTDPENILESGIDITVAPPGKIIKNLSSLSGGEQALVAISIYFAILAVNPSPFCVLDEIEAALDDVNVVRYAQYLHRISDKTQFIVITHRRGTMESADILYGVTMQEDGVSRILRLDPKNVDIKMLTDVK